MMKLSYFSVILAVASTVVGQSTTIVQWHPGAASNKCLDVSGDVRANGTTVQIFDCNGTPAQQWQVGLTRGSTSLRLANSDFCLDAGSDPMNGTQMKIWQCFDNLPAQEWLLTPDSRIVLSVGGLCLDLTNGDLTNGNVVQTWACTTGNTNQIWFD